MNDSSVKCSSGCPSQDHKSWGECLRAKSLQLSPAVNDGYATRQRAWDKELDNFESASRQGVHPAGTKQRHIDAAFKAAEEAA